VDWFDFFELAQDWVSEDREAYKRSAISRAYYAMYLTARDKLCDANRYHPDEGVSRHLYVWDKFKDYPEFEHIGELGSGLHRRRIKADYHGFIDDFSEVVEHAVWQAEELKDALEDVTHIR
jgi:uncharacterized protein (UPF0332 family)